jgi:glyoxylate reductase
MSTRVVVTRRLPHQVEARMADLFDVWINPEDRALEQSVLAAHARDCDVLVPSITDRIDEQAIAGFGQRLRLIAQFGNGYDNIDVKAAAARNITVTNTPSVLTEDTADMAMALIVAVPRRLTEGAQILTRQGGWPGWSPTWMLGRRLNGKSLGIVGLGRIGEAVARRAHAFGLKINYYARQRRPEAVEAPLEARFWPELDAMLAEVDIVTLHVPATSETHHLISAERLAVMKGDAFVVNVSRPELVDETALIEAIEQGRLSGAALDVFEHASGVNPRLLALARNHKVVLTAHMGSATLESRIEMGEMVMVNIRVFLDGHRPPQQILPPDSGS